MTSKTAEGGNHGVQLMETDHSKSGGELQSLSQHVTDMRNPAMENENNHWPENFLKFILNAVGCFILLRYFCVYDISAVYAWEYSCMPMETTRGFWLSSSIALKSYSLETGSLTELQNHCFGWVSRLASKLVGSIYRVYAYQYWLEACEVTTSCPLHGCWRFELRSS